MAFDLDGDTHRLFVRLSCVLEYKEDRWVVVHFHGSKPGETEDDSWHVNEWRQKNEALTRLVGAKTAELERKNLELMTEACLERVRAQAMGMRTPGDLLGICRVLYAELRALGFDVQPDKRGQTHDSQTLQERLPPVLPAIQRHRPCGGPGP